MSSQISCPNCRRLTEAGRFCQLCGISLRGKPTLEATEETVQKRRLDEMDVERRATIARQYELRALDDARRNLEAEEHRRKTMEREDERLKGEVERLKSELSRKTQEETIAQVYEYLSRNRGDIDPLRCAAELRVSEREVMDSLDLLQKQRRIERLP